MGTDMGVGPTYYAINDFSHYECDVVQQKIFPNYNPAQQNNPLVTWLSDVLDPTYGAGFYQAHEADTNACRLAGLTWISIPSSYKVYGQAGTAVGSWTNDPSYGGNYGVTSSTNGDTLALTTTTNGGPLYLWYQMNSNNGGTFSWNLDSTTTGSVATQGNNQFTYPCTAQSCFTVGAIRIPVQTPGSLYD